MPSLVRLLRMSAALLSACLLPVCPCFAVAAHAQVTGSAAGAAAAATGTPRASGTVKEVHPHDFVLTTPNGDVTVAVPDSSHLLIVPPGSTSLSSAAPGSMQDVQAGDRALVTGTPGDSATALSASRVVLMKSSAIAEAHAAQSSAWAQGTGGIVKSVSGAAIVISSGMKTITVQTTPATIVRRYAPGSVNFADATGSTLAAIQPGDQLRVRGARSGEGAIVTADEIVSGNFRNYSGTIASIDADAATLTLKDLATRKTVAVALTPSSDVRRLPPQMATMVAMHMRSGPAAASTEEEGAHRSAAAGATAQTSQGPSVHQGAGEGGGRAAGADLSRMLSRLPTETLGGLKLGEAVMIVATSGAADGPDKATAITLLVGVEPILAAPAGQSTTLSPWSMGNASDMSSAMSGGTQ